MNKGNSDTAEVGAMFKQIKNFFTEDAGVNRRKAPRVDARGEANVIIDGKSYRMKNWSTEGVLVGPYNGGLIAKQRSTSIRYSQEAGKDNVPTEGFDDPVWTDDQLEELEARKMQWIQMLHDLGHDRRWWDDVTVGAALPERVVGPHSIVSFATEWRSYIFTQWGGTHRRTDLDMEALGFVKEMAGHENDPVMEAINPEFTDGAYVGPSRGHLFPRWARFIGMPRGYGYGASMGAWITDYFAGWAGEWGMIRHSACNYRGPALTGDVTFLDGEVVTTCPYIWVDRDFALVRGWVQGFPKKLGSVWMTRSFGLGTLADPALAPGSTFGWIVFTMKS